MCSILFEYGDKIGHCDGIGQWKISHHCKLIAQLKGGLLKQLIVLIDLNYLALGMKSGDCNPIGKSGVVVQRWRNLNAKRGQTGEIVRERVMGRHVQRSGAWF